MGHSKGDAGLDGGDMPRGTQARSGTEVDAAGAR